MCTAVQCYTRTRVRVQLYTYVYSKFIVIYLLYLNKVSHTCIAAYVTRVQYAYYGARVRDRYVRSLQLYYYIVRRYGTKYGTKYFRKYFRTLLVVHVLGLHVDRIVVRVLQHIVRCTFVRVKRTIQINVILL